MERERWGEIAGRFTIVRTLGEGGMGVVYAVTDRRFPGAPRALKMLQPGNEHNPAYRSRFAQEVTAAAGIKSDHVVNVIDYDVTADAPWMLMELLTGETLEAHVSRCGPLPWDEARRLVLELGHGLGAAHAANVLHLDLKPANLFLANLADAHGTTRLKVMDFGLSRQIIDGGSHVTQSRAVGTEIWMPPEQFNKKAALRPTADVWPLGLMAFWMLTARNYWLAVDDRGDVEDMVPYYGELRVGASVPASVRARERRSDRLLPEGFDAWFARCVAVDPATRWPNGKEATDVLEAMLARASGSPRSIPPPARAVHQHTAEASRPMPPAGLTVPVHVVLPEATAAMAQRTTAPVVARRGGVSAYVGGGAALLVVGGLTAWAMNSSSTRRTDVQTPVQAAMGMGVPLVDAGTARMQTPVQPTLSCPSEMVLIPAGTFQMGSPDGVGRDNEHPQHAVTLAAFCMDRTEVTVAAYATCPSGTCTAPTTTAACNWMVAGRDNHPIKCVTWDQSRAYCQWVHGGGGDLPTEAQWEYAAAGGAMDWAYPWGNDAPANQLCWSGGSAGSRSSTCPVMSFPTPADAFGLFDMAGNVWEWTGDCYGAYSAAAAVNPTGPTGSCTYRVFRGGSWFSGDPTYVRAAVRNYSYPSYQIDNVGFRCARAL